MASRKLSALCAQAPLAVAESQFAAALRQIDWQRPWLAHLRAVGEPLAQLAQQQGAAALRWALTTAAAQQNICNQQGLPVQFIAQEDLPHGQAYEAYIYTTGQVPTRANLHDFFNALIWLHFPRIKQTLNALQAAEIAERGVTAVRGGTRDAATLFDENAALFVSVDAALIQALESFQWQHLFVAARPQWHQSCTVILFGHALLEKLVHPYKGITGHAWKVMLPTSAGIAWPMAAQDLLNIDTQVARQLQGQPLQSCAYSPLPILGIPQWWAENDEVMFYNDARVFRSGRSKPPSQPPPDTLTDAMPT